MCGAEYEEGERCSRGNLKRSAEASFPIIGSILACICLHETPQAELGTTMEQWAMQCPVQCPCKEGHIPGIEQSGEKRHFQTLPKLSIIWYVPYPSNHIHPLAPSTTLFSCVNHHTQNIHSTSFQRRALFVTAATTVPSTQRRDKTLQVGNGNDHEKSGL